MIVLVGTVLRSTCAAAGGLGQRRATFVDSGANEGFWSLLAAQLGCDVIAVEPQPACMAWIMDVS